jgi:ABC-2 type transport system permease protein
VTILVQVELYKLRTTRLSMWLLATATGLSAALALLEASQAARGLSVPRLSTAAGLTAVTAATAFSLLVACLLGVTVTSGEFRHGIATLTYLSFPKRLQVLIGKVVAAAIAGAVVGLAAAVATTGIGLGFARAHGDAIGLSAGTLAAHVAGTCLAAALLAVAGAGLGALVRSQLGATVAVFAWSLVAETAIGALFKDARPYLPYDVATTLAGDPLGNALGFLRLAPGPDALPFAASAALVLCVGLLLATAAAVVTVPRDVA